MRDLVCIPVTSLRVGDIAHAYGGIFEIIKTGESRGHIDGNMAYGSFRDFIGPSPVAVPIGRFVGGEATEGYFGPGKDWSFQGNSRAVAWIVPRR
jgi:hypothetical protein